MIYFIADTHFGHAGALLWNQGTVRPEFSSVEQMDETIVKNWNDKVTKKDTVYFLGDFAYKCSKKHVEEVFWRLNGKLHLVKGNHDDDLAAKPDFLPWLSISDISKISFMRDNVKQDIILCHYPMINWNGRSRGSWHLHGHTHGSIQRENRGINRYDCSVEVNNYTPISLDEIIEHFEW